jgi:ATP-dependent RNA helicase DDX31/DBP7
MVFFSTGDSVDWHFELMQKMFREATHENSIEEKDLEIASNGNVSALFPESILFKLHGSLEHKDRQTVYSGFSAPILHTSSILFCTDVAARGIDVPDVTNIIQYDPPGDVRDYIHRIGRTARVGREGSSHIFLLPSESEYLDLLEDFKCILKEQAMVDNLQCLIPLAKSTSKKSKHKSHEIAATDLHMALERIVQKDEKVYFELRKELLKAQKAYSSHIRAYTTHVASEKHIFHVKKLHLGHVAKSFCLQEAPQVLQAKANDQSKQDSKVGSGGGVTAGTMKRKAVQMARDLAISEFAAGDIIMKKTKAS